MEMDFYNLWTDNKLNDFTLFAFGKIGVQYYFIFFNFAIVWRNNE